MTKSSWVELAALNVGAPHEGSGWFGEKAIFYDLLTVRSKFGALTVRQALEINRHVLQLLAD